MSETRRFVLPGRKSWGATFEEDGSVTFDLSQLIVRDIAHNLSHVHRFSGAGATVAEHSVKLSMLCAATPEEAMQCLLHDAAEALGCADSNGWLKKKFAPKLREFEQRMVEAVWDHLTGLPPVGWAWLKVYDTVLGDHEAVCMGADALAEYALDERFNPSFWSAEEAQAEFILAWCRAGGKV